MKNNSCCDILKGAWIDDMKQERNRLRRVCRYNGHLGRLLLENESIEHPLDTRGTISENPCSGVCVTEWKPYRAPQLHYLALRAKHWPVHFAVAIGVFDRCSDHGAMLLVVHVQMDSPLIRIVGFNSHNMQTMAGTDSVGRKWDVNWDLVVAAEKN